MERCIKEGEIAEMRRAISDLERWQVHQNGSLIRLEASVRRVEEGFYEKLEDIKKEIRNLLVAVLLTMGTALLNLLLSRVR